MKRVILFCSISVCLLSSSCFIADNLTDSFRKINTSLEKSNGKLIIEKDALLDTIHKYASRNDTLMSKCDSMALATARAYDLLTLFKTAIAKNDSTAQYVDIASQFLINTPDGNVLKQRLLLVYSRSENILVHHRNLKADTALAGLKMINTDTAWFRKFFGEGVPSMAAITTLSKVQNDCLVVEKRCLNVLFNQMDEKR